MARSVTPLQALVLGCAGVGAFYVAAQWPRANASTDDSGVELALPPTGAAPRPAGSVSAVAAAASSASASASGPASVAAAASSPLTRLFEAARSDRATRIPGSTGDPFATLSWLPPPPPPPPPPPVVQAPPPAPPTAPPLPFAFIGMVEQGTPKPEAFLAKGDALLIVAAGDSIDGGVYRVESLSPTQIVLTHLPTNTRQTISIAGSTQ